MAARLQGFPRLTADADITPENSVANLERLAKALNELEDLLRLKQASDRPQDRQDAIILREMLRSDD